MRFGSTCSWKGLRKVRKCTADVEDACWCVKCWYKEGGRFVGPVNIFGICHAATVSMRVFGQIANMLPIESLRSLLWTSAQPCFVCSHAHLPPSYVHIHTSNIIYSASIDIMANSRTTATGHSMSAITFLSYMYLLLPRILTSLKWFKLHAEVFCCPSESSRLARGESFNLIINQDTCEVIWKGTRDGVQLPIHLIAVSVNMVCARGVTQCLRVEAIETFLGTVYSDWPPRALDPFFGWHKGGETAKGIETVRTALQPPLPLYVHIVDLCSFCPLPST